jgi:STE24 endopeptidase
MDGSLLPAVLSALLFGFWLLELASTLLNLSAFPPHTPAAPAGTTEAAELDRTREYHIAHSKAGLLQSAATLGALLAFWHAGGFPWLDQWCRSITHGPVSAGLLFLSVLFLAGQTLSLPFDIHDTFVIENRFGFNRSTPRTFVLDRIRILALAAALGLPLTAAVLWILTHVPHAWLWAWLLMVVFQIAMVSLAPTLILPLFNRFSPMPEGSLKKGIESLARRCGFPLQGVFVIDGSKRSTKANAFFTGIGRHKRIALYDTLMEKCSEPELLAILAHEIGHFRKGHVRKALALSIIHTGLLCFVLGLVTDPTSPLARALAAAFGWETVSAHAGLTVFAILLGPVSVLAGIATNAWSRRNEYEADSYAAEATGGAQALASALGKLHADHLAHPCPAQCKVWLDYSHPPLPQRLAALGIHGPLPSAPINGGPTAP